MENFTLLSHYLIQLREKYGLSRLQWAEQSGVSRITLWRWEADVTLPRASELEQALDALGVTPEERVLAIQHWNRARGRIVEATFLKGDPTVLHRGDLLVSLRMRKDWTQTEAAARSGIPRATLTKWEKMGTWPSVDRLRDLLAVYEASEQETEFLTSSMSVDEAAPFDLTTLAQSVEAYSQEWQNHEELALYKLAEQVHLFALRQSDALPLLAQVYTDYLRFLVGRSRFKEAQLYVTRLEQFPELPDPVSVVRVTMTRLYAMRVLAQLSKKETREKIAERLYPMMAALIPLVDEVGIQQQSSILAGLSELLRVRGLYKEALRLNQSVIQRAKSLSEDYQWQYLQERLWLLHEMGRYEQVLAEIPDPLPALPFFQVTMMFARGRALNALGRVEAGRQDLADAYELAKQHELLSLGKLILEELNANEKASVQEASLQNEEGKMG